MIFTPFEWFVAGRYLRARRAEGLISVIAGFSLLGIALGVATLIIVMAVMNGFRVELMDRILGLNGHIMVQGAGGPVPDFDALGAKIARIEGVVRVTPIVDGQVMAQSRTNATGALVRGVRADDVKANPALGNALKSGDLVGFEAGRAVLLGTRLAARLGLSVDDRLTLIAPQGTATAIGFVPRMIGFTVGGTFEVGMYEYDSGFIFMPLKRAQRFFQTGQGVTALEVMLDDPDRIATLKPALARLAGPGTRLFDWQQANQSFFTALQVERNVMFLILTLIILVAAFNIISSLIMLVKDKSRDIAILRTMGATRGMILRIFFLSGAAVGVIGTVVGVALGIAFTSNIATIRGWLEGLTGTELWSPEIRFLSEIPAEVDSLEVAMVIAMALGLSFVATLYPSWRAARLDPVEALRRE